jgi:asparagine synthetase B (glutamine-hydrolysing)
MMNGAGVLGYIASGFDQLRINAAQSRAPWRGPVSAKIAKYHGCVAALGSAMAGDHGHLGIAFHGRIDNLPALASKVGVSPEDTISILGEAYLQYGETFADQLLGGFAILVLDEKRRVLLGARDWVGSRPLFWGEHEGVIAFASEVKQVSALLDRSMRLDETTASEFRRMEWPGLTATFVHGVQAVEPSGQVLVSAEHAPRATRRPIEFTTHELSMSESAALIRTRLDTAVERRMKGSTRPCALVSGGMDSTSVAATASSLAKRGLVSPLVAGIGLHFPEVPKTDETGYAQELVYRWEIPWFPVTIMGRDLLADPTEMLVLHDGPPFPGVQFFDRMFATASELGADLVLTGQLADLWQTQNGEEILFSALRQEWKSMFGWTLHRVKDRPRWTAKQLAKTGIALFRERREGDIIADRVHTFWTRFACEIEERLGQYHGFQVESPFYDRELAEAMAAVSPALRSDFKGEKLPLRAAMTDRLPTRILGRMDKSFLDPVFEVGYGQPYEKQTIGQMVAEHYLAAWRCHLTEARAERLAAD